MLISIGGLLECGEELPSEIAPIIGDAVHNARSALDLLACAAVEANKGSTNGVYFPIIGERPRPDCVGQALRNAHINRADKQAIDVFTRIESYSGGKHEALTSLHALDKADKHRLLLPVVGVGSIDETLWIDGMNIWPGLDKDRFILEDGSELFRTDSAVYKRKIGDELNATFQVVFGKGQPLYGEPVIPALTTLVEMAEGIVELFEGII